MSFLRFSDRHRNRAREEQNVGDDLVPLPVVQPPRRRRARRGQPAEDIANIVAPLPRIATRSSTAPLRTLQQRNVEIDYLRLNREDPTQVQGMDFRFRGSRAVHYRRVPQEERILHILQYSLNSFDNYINNIRRLLATAMQAAWQQLGAFRAALHMDIEVMELNDMLMDDHPIPQEGSLTSNVPDPPTPIVTGRFQTEQVLGIMIAKLKSALERMQGQASQLIFHMVVRTRLSCASTGRDDNIRWINRRVRAGRGTALETHAGWESLKMPWLLRGCLMDVYHEEHEDNMCFYYALWYGMLRKMSQWEHLPDESSGAVEVKDSDFDHINDLYPTLRILDNIPFEESITYPVHPNDLYRVDMRLRKLGFALNAYHYQGNEELIGTLYTSHHVHQEGVKHIDLLLINTEEEAEDAIDHWVLIIDFPMLVSANTMFARVYKSLKGKRQAALRLCAKATEHDWVCRICIKRCKTEEEFQTHVRLCTLDRLGGKGCTEVYSEPDKARFAFYDYSKLFLDPFVVYADFECLVQQAVDRDAVGGSTTQDQLHIPISCCFRVGTHTESHREWIPKKYRRMYMIMDRQVVNDSLHETKTTKVADKFLDKMMYLRECIQEKLKEEPRIWETPCSIVQYYNLCPEKCEHCCFCRIPLGIQDIDHPLFEDKDAFDRGPCVAFQPFEDPDSPSRLLGLAHRLCFWKFLGNPYAYSGKFGGNETTGRRVYNERVAAFPYLFNDMDEVEDMERLFTGIVARTCHRYYTDRFILKIFFHNLTGYDGHLLVQALEQNYTDIRAIPQSGDKFLSLSFNGLHFLDSYKFLKGRLDDLAQTTIMCKIVGKEMHFDNLAQRDRCIDMMRDALECIGERFEVEMNAERIELLLRKGVFPYEYFQTPEVLDELQIPPIEAFDSRLNDSHIEEEEYEHVKRVWSSFNMHNFKDYHDLYLYVDVMLLHMIFQCFREQEYKLYGFDVTQFYSLPGYAFAQCLYLAEPLPHQTNAVFQLDLLHNQQTEIAKMMEGMKRGGISCIMTRHCKIEDPQTEEIKLLDANNLYGYAMEQPLPVGNYRYLSQEEIELFMENNTLMTYDRLKSDKGYILEVDLHLPETLHEKFRYYPMFPIKRRISYAETSDYYKSQKEERDHDDKTEKLILDMHDRFYYSTYIGLLQLGLEEGYVLKKVHRILEYRQHPWMRSHIQRQTLARQKATTAIGKEVPKLTANSTYGKTIEDSRRHQTVKIVTTAKEFTRIVKSPTYESHRIVNEGVAVVHKRKTHIKMNRPIMVGVMVLELSKLLMYTFYYKVLYKQFGSRLRLLMTDTDSLGIHVTGLTPGRGIIEELREHHDRWFDLSNYPSEMGYSTSNNKVVGKMKDEFVQDAKPGKPAKVKVCKEFIGLKSKMLCFDMEDNSSKVVGKGISRTVLKKHITNATFRQAMFDQENPVPSMEMHSIRSSNNRLYTYRMEKSTLDALDDKVYLVDRQHCIPYGYVHLMS